MSYKIQTGASESISSSDVRASVLKVRPCFLPKALSFV